MKTKTFDAVEMKRKGAEAIQKKTAMMSSKQELQFWKKQTDLLRQQQAENSSAQKR